MRNESVIGGPAAGGEMSAACGWLKAENDVHQPGSRPSAAKKMANISSYQSVFGWLAWRLMSLAVGVSA